MTKTWDELWQDPDKIKRWSVPDYHFLEYFDKGRITNGKPLRALDMGCGLGRHSFYLASNGYEVDAVDPSLVSIEFIKEKNIKMELPIKLYNDDLSWLSEIKNDYYDFIVCWNVIYHDKLIEMKKALKHFYRVLAPGGRIVLTLNSINNIHYGKGIEVEKNTFIKQKKIDGDHPHHYSDKEEVMELLSDFDIISLSEDEEEVGGLFKDRWHWYIYAQKK